MALQLVKKVPKDFFDKLPEKLQNRYICNFILQFLSLRRVIEREREPISALSAAACAAVALRSASLRLGVTVPFHTILPSETFGLAGFLTV